MAGTSEGPRSGAENEKGWEQMAEGNGGDAAQGQKRRGRPTMTDVARIAGVSQSSVSLVLNEMTGSRISADTQNRVFEAARQIGYALPAIRREAQALTERNTIAYLVDEISTSPHPVVNLDGARDFAFEQDFLVAAHVTRSNPELEAATIASIKRDKSVIGIIYSTIFTRLVTLPKALEDFPTVLLNCYAEPRKHISILPGEVAGGFAATAHLTELGHRRIGFINGEPWMDASVDRLKGYRQALATADIAFDEKLVRNGDWLPLTGYHHAFDLLVERQSADCDALWQRSDGDRRAWKPRANSASKCQTSSRSWATTTKNWRATHIRRSRRWCCPTTRWDSARPRR